MKAIVYQNYGPPEVLHVHEIDPPLPGDNEVRIRVRATEVTKADCELRSFRFPVKWFWLPMRLAFGMTRPRRAVLGGYFAGEVESIGKKVTAFQVGDAVYGSTGIRMGAYGELICLPVKATIAPKPRNLSWAEAAAVPLGALNALLFMRLANIRPGEKLLINGAGGSIGVFAAQIAKDMGAEVTAVDHGGKAAMLRGVGVDHFIDYTREDFAAGDRTWDIIFNMVAGSSYARCVKALRPGGRYLMGNPRISDMLRTIATGALTDKTASFAFAGEKTDELRALTQMLEQERIRPVVDGILSMEAAAEAHRRVETEARLGAVVLAIGESGVGPA